MRSVAIIAGLPAGRTRKVDKTVDMLVSVISFLDMLIPLPAKPAL